MVLFFIDKVSVHFFYAVKNFVTFHPIFTVSVIKKKQIHKPFLKYILG